MPNEHSRAAAAAAAVLARDGKVDALMKGSLHTVEFTGAIVHEKKLHTARRKSRVSRLSATAAFYGCGDQHLPDAR
jgi:phosphotransacetylase